MKKLMVGILIIIPLVIMVTVAAVSVFVSTKTHIAVDEVVLDAEYKEISLQTEPYVLSELFDVKVYPQRASNKDLEWTLSNVETLDEQYKKELESGVQMPPPVQLIDGDGNVKDTVDEQGSLRLHTFCTFVITVSADGISDSCRVYVAGYAIERVEVSEQKELTVGESVLMETLRFPIDAIVHETIWASSDESVAIVDNNGVVTAVGSGETEITVKMSVYGEEGEYIESAPTTVKVNAAASAYGNTITISGNSTRLDSLGLSSEVVIAGSNVTLSETHITINDTSAPATVLVGGAYGTVVSLYSCEEDDIVIKNADLLSYDTDSESGFVLEAGESLVLSALWRDTLRQGTPDKVIYTSSRTSVADFVDGKLVGLDYGTTVITAERNGKSDSITISVRSKVTVLLVQTTNESLQVGIAAETVFGSAKYEDDNNPSMLVNNSFEIVFLRPILPTDASQNEKKLFYSAFEFTATENGEPTDKVYFEDNIIVFDRDKITQLTNLVITVKAKYPKYTVLPQYTTATFELKVTDGISVTTYAAMKRAAEVEKKTVCMASNIQRFDGGDGDRSSSVEVSENFYGNYYLFSGTAGQYAPGTEYPLIRIVNDNVLVSNVRFRANEVGEEINDSEGVENLNGVCFIVGYKFGDYSRHYQNVRIEYSIIENARICGRSYGADLTIDGCIIRNSYETGIYIKASMDANGVLYSHVTLNNNVMSNLFGMGMSLHYSGYDSGYGNKELADAAVQRNENIVLNQTGFLDIYNWQNSNALSLLPQGIFSAEVQAAVDMLIQIAVTSGDGLKKYSVVHDNLEYLHLGFMASGLVSDNIYAVTNFEDSRFKCLTAQELAGVSLPFYLYTYGKEPGQILPDSTYKVNERLFAYLRGDTVNA